MNQSEKEALCGLVAESLSAYLDRSLPAPVERQIALHLEQCPACRRRLESMNALLADLQTLGEVEAGPELGWAIKRQIRRQARRERTRLLVRPVPFLASTAAAAAVFIIIGLGQGPERGLSVDSLTDQNLIQAGETPLWERRYVLPAQVDALNTPALADRAGAGEDSTAVRRPTRLTGVRAVSF